VAGLAERSNVSRSARFYDLFSSLNLRSATAMIPPRNEADHETDKRAYLYSLSGAPGETCAEIYPKHGTLL
jgi:hypothetical protein